MAEPRVLVGIPTKDRPEYLAGLLATLLFQQYQRFDVLVVDTGEQWEVEVDTQVDRFVKTLRGTEHDVTFVRGVAAGDSMVVPTNRILVEAEDRGYDWVYKVDDDHVLPPDALSSLLQATELVEAGSEAPVLVSGVTPWMHRVWEKASGPDDPVKMPGSFKPPLTDVWLEPAARRMGVGHRHEIDIGHFDKYGSHTVVRTKLASAANFLMRPDTRILWADMCGRSLYADVVWFLQLQSYLGYELYFETGVWAWHVTAPSGGTRTGQEDHVKGRSEEEALRKRQVDRFLEATGWTERGLPERATLEEGDG